jgi:hypothetical protein
VIYFLKHIYRKLRSGPRRRAAIRGRLPLHSVRQSLESLLHDCESTGSDRMLYKIQTARTPAELWVLRCDLHQCISRRHDQTEASRRINTLVPVFSGWVPSDKLNNI